MSPYLRLGDVHMDYEMDGNGDPLVMLHPGHTDSRALEINMPGLTKTFPDLPP